MAAAVVARSSVDRPSRRVPFAETRVRTVATTGAFCERPEELAARPERVGDPLVALDRSRRPQLAGYLGEDQLARRDPGLVDLGEVRDRRGVVGSGQPDRHRQSLRDARQRGGCVADPRQPMSTLRSIELTLCLLRSYN